MLILLSFNQSTSRAEFTGFTLKWYLELLQDRQILEVLGYTLAIALLSTLVATIIGTLAAIGIVKMRPAIQSKILAVTNLPVINPDIVTGVSLMIIFVLAMRLFKMGELDFTTMLFAHITFNIPYVIFSCLPRLRQLDPNIYEAALDLGATPFYALRKVILPQIKPGIISGALLAFTLSFDDFVISFFTTGSGVSNLSIYIYSMARIGVSPKINALSTIVFFGLLILVYGLNKKDAITGKQSEIIIP